MGLTVFESNPGALGSLVSGGHSGAQCPGGAERVRVLGEGPAALGGNSILAVPFTCLETVPSIE